MATWGESRGSPLGKAEAGPNPFPLAAQDPPFGPGASSAHSRRPSSVFCPITLLYRPFGAELHKRELSVPQQPRHKASLLPQDILPS